MLRNRKYFIWEYYSSILCVFVRFITLWYKYYEWSKSQDGVRVLLIIFSIPLFPRIWDVAILSFSCIEQNSYVATSQIFHLRILFIKIERFIAQVVYKFVFVFKKVWGETTAYMQSISSQPSPSPPAHKSVIK